jgi:hypothetical protein
MDQRTSERYETSLNALVHPHIGKAWLCTIKDFCEGGMLLVEQEGRKSPRGKSGINTGDVVGIHFSVPLTESDEHFRFEGKIVRVMDSGVGISFMSGMADKALDALADFSGATLISQQAESDDVDPEGQAEDPTANDSATEEESPASAEGSVEGLAAHFPG